MIPLDSTIQRIVHLVIYFLHVFLHPASRVALLRLPSPFPLTCHAKVVAALDTKLEQQLDEARAQLVGMEEKLAKTQRTAQQATQRADELERQLRQVHCPRMPCARAP